MLEKKDNFVVAKMATTRYKHGFSVGKTPTTKWLSRKKS